MQANYMVLRKGRGPAITRNDVPRELLLNEEKKETKDERFWLCRTDVLIEESSIDRKSNIRGFRTLAMICEKLNLLHHTNLYHS